VTPGERWRLFVALRVPPAVADQLAQVARASLPPRTPVRWVDPADLHLTLWFIGPLPPTELPNVAARVARAAGTVAPFACRIEGAGAFGHGKARAVWVGLAEPGAGTVAALAAEFDPDDRPHQAHITVCRGGLPAFAAAVAAALGDRPALAWIATDVEVLRSHPGRRPSYETVASFSLGPVASA